MTKSILSHADAILEAAIEQAKQGHYSITRLLFAIAGLYPAPRGPSGGKDHSLADFLCQQLGLPEPESNSAQTTPPTDAAHSLE